MNLKPDDKKKAILMGGLLILLGGVMYYNFFGEDEYANQPGTPRRTTAKVVATPTPTPKTGELPVITEPLVLASMTNKPQDSGVGRNIFVYPPPPTPTPIPPQPPPPPPPITLSGLNPPGVIGKTGDFTLTAIGAKFPADAKVFISGREHKATFVSENQLKVQVPGTTISNPGSLPVEVRSASDPKLYSNVFSLSVTPPPAPPYKYVGRLVKNGVTTAVVKFDLEEGLLNVRKDTVLGGHWKIISITEDALEFEDTNIKIRHRVPFTGEGG